MNCPNCGLRDEASPPAPEPTTPDTVDRLLTWLMKDGNGGAILWLFALGMIVNGYARGIH